MLHKSHTRPIIPTSAKDRNGPDSSGKINGSDRKASEIDGNWNQYSGPEDRWIIPPTSGHVPPEITGIWPDDTRKIRKFFLPGILLPWNRRNYPEPTISLLSDLGRNYVFNLEYLILHKFTSHNLLNCWNCSFDQNWSNRTHKLLVIIKGLSQVWVCGYGFLNLDHPSTRTAQTDGHQT